MPEIISYDSSLNKREKYSSIALTYWEVEDLTEKNANYLFRLDEVISFSVNDDPIYIDIEEQTTESGEEFRFDYRIIRDTSRVVPQHFPRKGDTPEDFPTIISGAYASSPFCVWGEDDNISITSSELTNAEGEVKLEYNVKEQKWQAVVVPPSTAIGVNENFSLTLEGSIPALAVNGAGFKYTKKTIHGYTEHYGKVSNELEIELPHITNKNQAFHALQRLLNKYNTILPQINYEYVTNLSDLGREPVRIINNYLTPKSTSISVAGDTATVSAESSVLYNPFDDLFPSAPYVAEAHFPIVDGLNWAYVISSTQLKDDVLESPSIDVEVVIKPPTDKDLEFNVGFRYAETRYRYSNNNTVTELGDGWVRYRARFNQSSYIEGDRFQGGFRVGGSSLGTEEFTIFLSSIRVFYWTNDIRLTYTPNINNNVEAAGSTIGVLDDIVEYSRVLAPLEDVSYDSLTLNELQYNIHSYIH